MVSARHVAFVGLAAVLGCSRGVDESAAALRGAEPGGAPIIEHVERPREVLVTGPVAFTVGDAVAVNVASSCPDDPDRSASVVALAFADEPGLCARLKAGSARPREARVLVALSQTARGQGSVATGRHLLSTGVPGVPGPGGPFVAGVLWKGDEGCLPQAARATAGAVTLSRIAAERVEGTLELTLANGGQVRGSFAAPVCAVELDACAPNASLLDTAPPASCQP